ncbi:glycosyltransferase family 8 protein [Karstenula rhodostoma CBS 690.94]|uniref:Glycosyltransferase family 8 protein n=1 Tax=Karstenula rhodostoma CBS 690.94 TaxID=1392251 RepID=A0A9P4UFV3_9PLEO|nr:glycosyltransferase family 8 protein [Karstenula rhodostoma CBS 690.94]
MIAFSERRRFTAAVFAFVTTILLFLALHQTHTTEAIRVHIGIGQDRFRGPIIPSNDIYRTGSGFANGSAPVLATGKERFAYVTFLSGTLDAPDDLDEDNYFVATRILVWQLLHKPETRTNGIDVVVMVTPSVSASRRARLAKDGAIIRPVDFLHVDNDDWIHAARPRGADVVTKLRAWEMTQYSRILMLDGATMLRLPLDGVFDDKAAKTRSTKRLPNPKPRPAEAPLPPTYLLASLSETADSAHDVPPKDGADLKKPATMNAAFMLLTPSLPVFDYYRSLLNITNAFDPLYPAQNLLNHAHRRDGPMPWSEVDYKWNMRCPTENDFEKGLVSMHEKWWTQPDLDGNQKVKDWLRAQRWEMKGWLDAWDLRHA